MKVEENKDLTEFSAYKVKSSCAKAYFPECEEDVVSLYKNNPTEQFTVIGNGNNIIFAKEYYNKSFIILNGCLNKITVENDCILAEAGATLLKLSETALKYGLTGLEAFYDIPSSVGGAVVMNAGNKDAEIKDILVKVRYLNLVTSEIKELTNKEASFHYRSSFFQENNDNIILKAWFKLRSGNPENIHKTMEQGKKIRWEKQPRDYPSCGSVFKRPEGRFVGPMLDELGLKGFAIGGAQVSKKHSGFIINTGNATGHDILSLIEEIQRRVKLHFDVDLEIEQRVII